MRKSNRKKSGFTIVRRSLPGDRIRYFKSEARKILFRPQNYPKFLAGTLIYILLSAGISAATRLVLSLAGESVPDGLADYLAFALYLLLAMPMGVGFYLFALRSVESAGRAPSISVMLEPFSSAKLLSRVYRCFLAYLWRLGVVLAVIAAGFGFACRVYDAYVFAGFPAAGALLMLCICAVTLILAHFLAVFFSNIYPLMAVALKNRDLSLRAVAKVSKALMRGHRLELCGLVFSFGFWAFFSVVTVGVAFALFAAPYFVAAHAVYSCYLCDLQGKSALICLEEYKNNERHLSVKAEK